jgi:hypothetical protein
MKRWPDFPESKGQIFRNPHSVARIGDVEVFGRPLDAACDQRDAADDGEADVLLSEPGE